MIPKVTNNPINASTVAPTAIPIIGDISPAIKLPGNTTVSFFVTVHPLISPLGIFFPVPFFEIFDR